MPRGDGRKPNVVNIQVAFVYGSEREGRASQITVPAERDMSVKDVRDYILKVAKGEDGTVEDQETIKLLVEKSGVSLESINEDPIQIIQAITGTFMEEDISNCPIVERTHVLFLHPQPIQ